MTKILKNIIRLLRTKHIPKQRHSKGCPQVCQNVDAHYGPLDCLGASLGWSCYWTLSFFLCEV